MKQIIKTIIVPCIAILLAGCSNTLEDSFNGDFEDVFRKEYTNVFDPIDPFAELLPELPSPRYLDMRYIGYIETLVSSVLVESGARMPRVKDENGYYWSVARGKEVFATEINDKGLIKDVVDVSGATYSWPEIDFSRYSLVLGWFIAPGSGYYIEKQRVWIKNNHDATLYLSIKEDQTPGYYHLDAETPYYFATLFPKFNSDSIQVVSRWD